jgi:hypothetical protein
VLRRYVNSQCPWNNFRGPQVGNRCSTVCRDAVSRDRIVDNNEVVVNE